MSRHFFCFALYREPGSNRHAHHWAKDFKSFLSTNSNIAATKSGAKVLLFYDICKYFDKKIIYIARALAYINKFLYLCALFIVWLINVRL